MKKIKKNEHYKMYKAGKQWLFASLATVTLLGGAASSLDSTFLSHFAPSLMSKVSADDASGLDNIKFDTPEDALIGTWIDLKEVDNQAPDGKQYINYQAKNLYVRKDTKTHKLVANYIAGRTTITLTSMGARNSMVLQTSSDGGKNWKDVKKVQAAQKNGSVDFTIPYDIDTNNAQIRVGYQSDRNQKDGSSGDWNYYTPADVAIVSSAAQAAQQKTDEAQAEASLAQKKTTQENLDQEYQKVQDEINGDTGLTTAAKNQQLVDAKKAYETASNSYQENDNAADTKTAETTGIQNIDNAYQKPETLDNQRADARQIVDTKAKQANKDINANPNMTDAEKTAALKKVKDAQDTLDSNISKADADGIPVARDEETNNKNITTANNDFEKSLPIRVIDATNQIEQDRQAARAKVANDPTLTSDEKTEQNNAIDKAASDATSKIKSEANAQSVVDDMKDVDSKIEAPYKAGTSLATQKQTATQKFTDLADQTNRDIDNDTSLTDAEKDAQHKVVAAALTKAQQAITDVTNADDINKVRDGQDYSKDITGAHKVGEESLGDRKKNAQQAIDDARQNTENSIAGDDRLSTQQKADQKAAAENAWKKANAAINEDDADAQAIKDAADNGVTNIDNAYQAGQDLSTQATDAKDKIKDAADQAKADINSDSSLDDATKQDQSVAVDKAAENADSNVDNAKSADAINQATNAGVKNITVLKAVKTSALNSIDQAVKDTKAKIASDDRLSAAEKTEQNNKVDVDAATAKDTVNNEPDASKVATEGTNGGNSITTEYKPGKDLSDQKTGSEDKIKDAQQAAKSAVEGDSPLDESTKTAQKAAIDQAAQAAESNVSNAKTADEINQATSAGVNNINALSTAKKNANDAIDKAVTDTKAKIAADDRLSAADKTAQTRKVDSDATAAKSTINAETVSAKIADEGTNGANTIAAEYKPGKELSDQKTDAEDKVKAAATAAKAGVDNDSSLDENTKTAQKNAIDKAAQNADDAVATKTSADDINNATTAGIDNINALNAAKKSALSAVDQAVKNTKAKIASDDRLSAAEKTEQNNKVDVDAATAKDTVNNE
ncbi:DUF1542 domain-containing protein, partial [Fructobacillus fructosus]|uniref:DUF1542 domain-containing protein n=1 Tax=Fructobacillus fructosus TaxID=1631 RepID=UPI0030C81A2C